ncbi:MAG: two pore domain potassium channel family protein [Deltaproteobacteria bacterium]|nr:two pore domain potassium channel family protein [Deltaproteobacteria bacterium]
MSQLHCQYLFGHDSKKCPYPIWEKSDSHLCLLHDPSPEKPPGLVHLLIQEKLQKKDFHFEGYIFVHPVSFREIIFEEFANFENCQFLGKDTSFYRAQFKKGSVFNQSIFKGSRLHFSRCQFLGNFNLFNHCQFLSEEMLWTQAEFKSKNISFASSIWKGNQLDFRESLFQGDVFFTQSRFEIAQLSFQKTLFDSQIVSFPQCHFQGLELDFSESRWHGGHFDFTQSLYHIGSLRFYPLLLENKKTAFDRCQFSGNEKVFYIQNSNSELSFQGVFFQGGKTKLKGDFQNVSFIETSLDQVDLNEVHWKNLGGRLICEDEIQAQKSGSIDDYRKAIDVCRNIKKCYEHFGVYEAAGNFYYGEMECKRKISSRKNWGGLQFMRITSGYGEKPIRVIFTSLFLILFCAFLYLLGGVTTPTELIQWKPFEDSFNFIKLGRDFLHCIYFSVVCFKTLGYCDYNTTRWSRVVGAYEGFICAFFIAMFFL